MLFLLFTKAITPCAVCSVLSQPVVSDSLQPHGLQPARPLCPGDSPGMNTGVGCHTLLQGIFQTQGQNPGLLYCRQILYHLSQQGIKYLYCYLQNRITSGIGQSDYPQVFRREADVFYGNKFQKQCKASRACILDIVTVTAFQRTVKNPDKIFFIKNYCLKRNWVLCSECFSEEV